MWDIGSDKVMIHIWVHLYEILLFSNQLKFFVIGASVVSIIAQVVYMKYFWNIDKTAPDEDNRLSHLQLREETS